MPDLPPDATCDDVVAELRILGIPTAERAIQQLTAQRRQITTLLEELRAAKQSQRSSPLCQPVTPGLPQAGTETVNSQPAGLASPSLGKAGVLDGSHAFTFPAPPGGGTAADVLSLAAVGTAAFDLLPRMNSTEPNLPSVTISRLLSPGELRSSPGLALMEGSADAPSEDAPSEAADAPMEFEDMSVACPGPSLSLPSPADEDAAMSLPPTEEDAAMSPAADEGGFRPSPSSIPIGVIGFRAFCSDASSPRTLLEAPQLLEVDAPPGANVGVTWSSAGPGTAQMPHRTVAECLADSAHSPGGASWPKQPSSTGEGESPLQGPLSSNCGGLASAEAEAAAAQHRHVVVGMGFMQVGKQRLREAAHSSSCGSGGCAPALGDSPARGDGSSSMSAHTDSPAKIPPVVVHSAGGAPVATASDGFLMRPAGCSLPPAPPGGGKEVVQEDRAAGRLDAVPGGGIGALLQTGDVLIMPLQLGAKAGRVSGRCPGETGETLLPLQLEHSLEVVQLEGPLVEVVEGADASREVPGSSDLPPRAPLQPLLPHQQHDQDMGGHSVVLVASTASGSNAGGSTSVDAARSDAGVSIVAAAAPSPPTTPSPGNSPPDGPAPADVAFASPASAACFQAECMSRLLPSVVSMLMESPSPARSGSPRTTAATIQIPSPARGSPLKAVADVRSLHLGAQHRPLRGSAEETAEQQQQQQPGHASRLSHAAAVIPPHNEIEDDLTDDPADMEGLADPEGNILCPLSSADVIPVGKKDSAARQIFSYSDDDDTADGGVWAAAAGDAGGGGGTPLKRRKPRALAVVADCFGADDPQLLLGGGGEEEGSGMGARKAGCRPLTAVAADVAAAARGGGARPQPSAASDAARGGEARPQQSKMGGGATSRLMAVTHSHSPDDGSDEHFTNRVQQQQRQRSTPPSPLPSSSQASEEGEGDPMACAAPSLDDVDMALASISHVFDFGA